MTITSLSPLTINNSFVIILMIITILTTNWRRARKNTEDFLLFLICINLISTCAFNIIGTHLIGLHSELVLKVAFFSKSFEYFEYMFIPFLLLIFCQNFSKGEINSIKWPTYLTPLLVGIVSLIYNIFSPLAFNISKTGTLTKYSFYHYYLTIGFIYLIFILLLYLRDKNNLRALNFPLFSIMIVLGGLAQYFLKFDAFFWCIIAITVVGIFSQLQNQMIYRDEVTALFNRDYFARVIQGRTKQKAVTGIVIDVTNYYQIYKHLGGAKSIEILVTITDAIKGLIGSRGILIRYSDNRFIILINSQDDKTVTNLRKLIIYRLEQFNNDFDKITLKLNISRPIYHFNKVSCTRFQNDWEHEEKAKA